MNQCSSKEIIELGNYDICLVETYPCKSKEELHMRERFYIEQNECVNKNIPTRSAKEFYDTHKKAMKIKDKKYYEAHKEAKSKQRKEFYVLNKERLLAKSKEYRDTHNEAMKIKDKEYYEANKKRK